MDTSEEIDRSFGDGPAHRPVAERIAAGRRHVARRRTVMGVCAAATIIVIGGASWAFAPGSTPSGDPDPVGVATNSPHQRSDHGTEAEPTVNGDDLQSHLMKGELATYAGDGTLVVRKGWRVTDRIANPFGLQPPNKSVGLELMRHDETYWYLLDLQKGRSSAASDPAGKGFATLDAWVADQVALQAGNPQPTPVEFRPGTNELVAVNGATIIRQQPDPNVPGFAEPAATTAVARVQWKGAAYFVLARRTGGPLDSEYFPTSADVPPRPTMKSFLAYASEQYGSGEGLR